MIAPNAICDTQVDVDSLGLNFVNITAGSFMMGSPISETGRRNHESQNKVNLTKNYELQTTHVTQKQYFDVMKVNPSTFKSIQYCPKTYQVTANGFTGCPNNPVESVSYYDAQEFIARLNGTLKRSYVYRLPTEAEFEFAARAGTATAYPFGENIAQLPLYAWFSENASRHTHEVAQLKPNAWGLYDTQGNAWQWVSDYYGNYEITEQTDPMGPQSGPYRVARGSSWISDAIDPLTRQDLRSASRACGGSNDRYSTVGFRLVRTTQ